MTKTLKMPYNCFRREFYINKNAFNIANVSTATLILNQL